jgi:hypothetical protein
MAVNYALGMFWSPGNLYESLIFFSLLYVPYPTTLLGVFSSFGFGGMKDPSV